RSKRDGQLEGAKRPFNRGALATSLRAGHSRARGTFDKPTTPETADIFRPPRTVRWAREWSGRAPTWTRDKPVKARGEPRQRRERPAPARPPCVCNWGNRGAVSATLVRLKGKVELRGAVIFVCPTEER